MKNLKKIAALVIVLAMALSSVAFAAFSDVDATSSYAEAINVMSALGIINGYEDGTFGPEKTITRAEFTTMLVNAMGMDNVGAVNTQFSDVTSNHWASGYISAGVAQGFINGYDATTFGPDDEVTYEQAVKMLICAVGYTPKFQIVKKLADGSVVRELDPSAYPSAYLAEANTAGVTAGVNQKVGDKASRQVVAKLVYNALTTHMMEQTSFGSDPEWSVPTSNYKTLLTDYLGVDKVEATVSAVSFDPTTAKKVTIQPTKIVEAYDSNDYLIATATPGVYALNSILALYDDTKVFPNDCKGYSCVMYMDNKADDNTVVAMFPKTGRNQVLSLDRTQFASYAAGSQKLMYWKNNDNDASALTAKLDSTFKVYVNRDTLAVVDTTFATDYSKGDKAPYTAIELIDNDNDGDYDIAFATDYASFVAGTINAKSYKITADADSTIFGGKKSVTLDPESEDTTFDIVDANGATVAFEDIVAGDVLNVFESEDNGYYYWKVMVTKDTVTGTVNAYDSTENAYSIGGTYYKTATTGMIEIGDAGTFYIDAYGMILKSALDASTRTFGFVYNADIDKADFEDEAALVVLDQTGKYVTYYFAKNTKIDGTSYKKEDLISKDLDGDGTDDVATAGLINAVSNVKGDIVVYEVNGAGEITALYSEDANGIEKIQNSKYKVKDNTAGSNYKASTQAIGGGFIDEETAMWACKKSTVAAATAKTDFNIAYSTAFADAETYKIKAVVDTTADNKIVAALVLDMTALADPETAVMYVTGVGQSKTEDGDNATTVTGMVNGEEVSFMVTDDTDILRTNKSTTVARTALAKGDVIQYTGADIATGVTVILKATDIFNVNANGDFTTLKTVAVSDISKEDEKKSDYLGMTNANGWLYGGKVYKMSGSTVTWAKNTVDGSGNPIVVEGDSTRVSNTLYTMLIRGNGKVYATEDIDSGIIETNQDFVSQKDASGNEIGTNDDLMYVYSYDGTMLAVVIVDPNNDTKF